MMKNIEEKIYWVGKVDDRPVPFHRLVLQKGTTYNSYFIDAEKRTIIDTVDIAFGSEFVKNLEENIDLSTIQYIVINHVEPDHAGALPVLINKAKNATIVATEKGKELLIGMFKLQNKSFLTIKDGDTLNLGDKTLKFFETPYLHTEETMITYCIEDRILFPCDIFSTHIANNELFNDLAKEDITEDFNVYYGLIMHPHRSYVRDMLKKIKTLDINMIAPSHGYILRKDVDKYINLYDEMSKVSDASLDKKALILFSSMTGNTSKIAQNLSLGLKEVGVESNVVNIKNTDVASIKSLIEEASAVIIGSSTKYGDMIGNLEDVLKELVTIDLSNKFGVAFGSYGWSGEAIEIINDYLKNSNITLLDSSYLIKTTGDDKVSFPLRVSFTPEGHSKDLCIKAGKLIGEIILKS